MQLDNAYRGKCSLQLKNLELPYAVEKTDTLENTSMQLKKLIPWKLSYAVEKFKP
jgi:hypothetical protein